MKPSPWLLASLGVSALLFAGCNKKASADASPRHSDHAEGETGGDDGVTFREGRGLEFAPDVIKALNLVTAEAKVRLLAPELKITAHVFATAPRVLASARVSAAQAEPMEKASLMGARLVRIDRSAIIATRLVDLIFELDASAANRVGDFVMLVLAVDPAPVLTVPRSAVVDGASGAFVYVVDRGAYLHTPVKVGARSSDFIEIARGLEAGDVVVVAPVNQLWLAELRLTKGGGHSH